MILSSVGNISFDKLVRYAEKHLANIPSNKKKAYPVINEYETRKLQVKKDILQPIASSEIEPTAQKDPKARTLILLSNLLGGPGMNSRLNLGIRKIWIYIYY